MKSVRIFIFSAGVLTFGAMIRSILISGVHNNNTLFLAVITAVLWIYAYFFDKLIKQKWLTVSMLTGFFILLAFSSFLFLYGVRTTTDFTEDIMIVLGAGIRDGEVGATLERRLNQAASYHQQNPYALIVVSGGIGHNEVISEAQAMATFLIERGVPANRILLEDMAYSTYTNMMFSMTLLQEYLGYVPSNIAVVTSNFHMYRAIRFAQDAGWDNVSIYSASVPLVSIPFSYLREVAAVVKMWVIGR